MPKNLENVKADILNVARSLLFDEGYNKLNMRKIAEKCGIATGTLYNYYSSKRDIVGEILQNEWNMMLRRIDINIKTESNILENLEFIFNELRILMNDVHNIWIDSSDINNDIEKIKSTKAILISTLIEKVQIILSKKKVLTNIEITSDVLSTILINYAYDNNKDFNNITPIILKLIT